MSIKTSTTTPIPRTAYVNCSTFFKALSNRSDISKGDPVPISLDDDFIGGVRKDELF